MRGWDRTKSTPARSDFCKAGEEVIRCALIPYTSQIGFDVLQSLLEDEHKQAVLVSEIVENGTFGYAQLIHDRVDGGAGITGPSEFSGSCREDAVLLTPIKLAKGRGNRH